MKPLLPTVPCSMAAKSDYRWILNKPRSFKVGNKAMSVARDDSVRETSEGIVTGMTNGAQLAQTYLPKDNR